MPANLLDALRRSLESSPVIVSADLRAMQRECAVTFLPQRCPRCHARLFDGWMFGQLKCWRCSEMFTGYLDRFLQALAKATT